MKPVAERLFEYYGKVARAIKKESEIASIFENPSDKGLARESIYAKFLTNHVPSSCNVFLGGFLFDTRGNESKQIDVLVVSHVSSQYKLLTGKSLAMIDGTLAAVSIKSFLSSEALEDSLTNIASIPEKIISNGIICPHVGNKDIYGECPFKVVFAYDGISIQTIYKKLIDFYELNPNIPLWKRPDIIHVLGKYFIVKNNVGLQNFGKPLPPNEYFPNPHKNSDVFALYHTLRQIQLFAMLSQHIFFPFEDFSSKLINPDFFNNKDIE